MCKLGGRDHNATSYSTETSIVQTSKQKNDHGRDHNATSYSTETWAEAIGGAANLAEIITLRAIALKHPLTKLPSRRMIAEIITLRAIALKLEVINQARH